MSPATVVTLTPGDWVEIYYALESKARTPMVQLDPKWFYHLRAIIEKIGPDGTNMITNKGA